MKKVIIFGQHSQAGYYLAQYLMRKQDTFIPIFPTRPTFDFLRPDFGVQVRALFKEHQPDYIFNFAAKGGVELSWIYPEDFAMVNATAVFSILDAMLRHCPKARFFQAGSASMFGDNQLPRHEESHKWPDSPYGAAKLMAYNAVMAYREKMGLFACTGIFFNAESPRRGEQHFTRKVVREALRISGEWSNQTTYLGKSRIIPEPVPMSLGRLDGVRDWGWMPEYVEVAWQMLQQKSPEDFVIGTGEHHTGREFVIEALSQVGVPGLGIGIGGAGVTNVYVGFNKFVNYVSKPEDESPVDGCGTFANPAKAEKVLGWKAKYKMADVIRMLIEAEIANGKGTAR